MLDFIIAWLESASWVAASLVFLAENLIVFGLAVAVGNWIARRPNLPRVSLQPSPLTRTEIVAASAAVALNTLVTLAGWQLWLHGFIRFRRDAGVFAVVDVVVLVLVMDALMYALHRIAHAPVLFELLHRFHHRYERVRPLSLFALSPLENLAFGLLWISVISVYSASWAGMSVYLALNVAFGTVGHLGVEPVPAWLAQNVVCGYVAGSSFHAQHHQDRNHNFGFYTLIWDRVFGTIRPDYGSIYGRLPDSAT